ncbi:MAG: multiheme c-type cytochrome [Stellaceae bacterium]
MAWRALIALGWLAGVLAVGPAWADSPSAPRKETAAEMQLQSAGCMTCHTTTDSVTMHSTPGVVLGCADCHGGNPMVMLPPGARRGSAEYRRALDEAHVHPRFPAAWNYPNAAIPQRTYTLLNKESPEFIRFMNPSDYRVAAKTCGSCHMPIVQAAMRSLMATTAMFWAAAAYNNGILPMKRALLGEAYTPDGQPATLMTPEHLTHEQMLQHDIVPQIYPLPAWETMPSGDVFRVFERGGRVIGTQFPEIGNPDSEGDENLLDEPGRPDLRQSNRGPATGLKVSIPVLNLIKTRLNDPDTWFLGTNDNPGDYRSSGCASCHVVYANDRDVQESGPYAADGNRGTSLTLDPTIPHNQSGLPLRHVMTTAIPTSQCMICHMHQPNLFLNSMLGYTMWDYETAAPQMWPKHQRYPTDKEVRAILQRDPEGAVVRGKWADPNFSADVSELNPQIKDTQFADYHGHGWNFRAVYKRDRHGNLLDDSNNIISPHDPQKFKKAVHLDSIHVDYGMQCVDCHFSQDNHGNGHLYTEVQGAIEITCSDCHGTATSYPDLKTHGPAAPPHGTDLSLLRTPDGRALFEWRDGKLYQRSEVYPGLEWRVTLVKDTVTPGNPEYDPIAARAKLMSTGSSMRWGPGVPEGQLAHSNDKMACYTCHLSWTTSCGGCHLPIEANQHTPLNHYEGGVTRNYATYNPQVARQAMFQLGLAGTIKNNIIAPIASRSALVLSSTNINREHIYVQQPSVSSSGYSSQAFSAHYPHTERRTETKTCTDCHVSAANDNNAIMAQLLLLGTDFVNFVGLNSWVGETHNIEAVRVTEWDEPQAVIGSYLQRYAYPDNYKKHVANNRELTTAYGHHSLDARCIQLRGEYLYVAEGADGMRVYDVASIANKGFSERIVTAPVSPLGQDTHIPSKDATCVVLPTDQPINPARNAGVDEALDPSHNYASLMRGENQEQVMHPIYNYAYITDAAEGLILTNVNTLTDQEPRNNFLTRALTWNENGILNGARYLTIAGTHFYVTANAGIVELDMNDPLHPKVMAVIPIKNARATFVQFRYLFVADANGLDVVNITHPNHPVIVPSAHVPLRDARQVFVSRTYAYIADGRDGLAIVDVERPEQPHLYMQYTADGKMTDANDVVVAATNASDFAYVADGVNGLKVIQLMSPTSQPNFYGFSPAPKPHLIAWKPTESPALSLSRGLERDRAVDETGNQIAVFDRIGSRPFRLNEMKKLYMVHNRVFHVTDSLLKQDFVPARK